MDLVYLDNDLKRQYLERNMLVSFVKGKNDFITFCDICEKKLKGSLRISKNDRAYSVSVKKGEFHHLDGNPTNDVIENIRLFCYRCHKIVHLWGILQRWMDQTGKTVKDLPDSRKLKPMKYRKY